MLGQEAPLGRRCEAVREEVWLGMARWMGGKGCRLDCDVRGGAVSGDDRAGVWRRCESHVPKGAA